MPAAQSMTTGLRVGTFVRVRDDHSDCTRAGRDAVVVSVSESGLGLIFGTDRYGREQGAVCVGIEAWHEAELDLDTAEQ
jgi:hypothetical protein